MKHGDRRLSERVSRLLRTKTVRDPSGCLIWTGARTKAGYPTVTEISGGRRSSTTATRLIFVDRVRDLKAGEVVHHKCGNASCVEPSHLEGATTAQNGLEMFERKSLNATVDFAENFIVDSEDALLDCLSQDREDPTNDEAE